MSEMLLKLFTEEKPIIDLVNNNIFISGLNNREISHLSVENTGITSFKLVPGGVFVAWYDLNNLLKELKKFGYNEAEFASENVRLFIERINNYYRLLKLLKEQDINLKPIENFGKNRLGYKGLYKVQRSGVAFLLTRRVSGLFDEMGMGKTVMTLYAYGLLRLHKSPCRCLILCPKSVKLEWKKAFRDFLDLDASYLEENKNADILIVHYEQLINRKIGDYIKESLYLKRLVNFDFDVMIVDESHFIKNIYTKRSRAFQILAQRKVNNFSNFSIGFLENGEEIFSHNKLPFIWFLTGTPMEYPRDIYPVLRTAFGSGFISLRNFVNTFTKFETKYYFNRKILKPVGIKNEQSLIGLVESVSLRRKRSEIVEIPYIDRVLVQSYDKKHWDAFWKVVKEVENPLARVIKGIQFNNHPLLVGIDLDSPKHNACLEIIKSVDDKVVVWSVFREAVDLLALQLEKFGIKVVKFFGGISDKEFNLIQDSFLNGDTKVCIATISKGAFGVNFMKNASVVIYLEKPFSYSYWVQSRDRVMRIDRDKSKPVLFIDLQIENSPSDALLDKVIREKTDLNRLILEGYGIEIKE